MSDTWAVVLIVLLAAAYGPAMFAIGRRIEREGRQ